MSTMKKTNDYTFDLHVFVLLLFSGIAAAAAATLTYLSGQDVPRALIAGGVAGAGAITWGKSNVRPPRDDHRLDKHDASLHPHDEAS
ncbi:hypothetical protein [Thermomonospora catenispora]|uniref:hypothetical protein n=1 Tax=Thermomonospora catenispora TaxID=2493090 RepID=UPI00112419CD|nr:hypothetical protein [Thermomonospora catenispora]TNY37278.1 hypothetical protein EIO00_09070 [Thermomonospora catenispora]